MKHTVEIKIFLLKSRLFSDFILFDVKHLNMLIKFRCRVNPFVIWDILFCAIYVKKNLPTLFFHEKKTFSLFVILAISFHRTLGKKLYLLLQAGTYSWQGNLMQRKSLFMAGNTVYWWEGSDYRWSCKNLACLYQNTKKKIAVSKNNLDSPRDQQ